MGRKFGDWKPPEFQGFKGLRSEGSLPTSTALEGVLGGGFKDFLFSPLFGEDSHFDSHFLDGLKPPTSVDCVDY